MFHYLATVWCSCGPSLRDLKEKLHARKKAWQRQILFLPYNISSSIINKEMIHLLQHRIFRLFLLLLFLVRDCLTTVEV